MTVYNNNNNNKNQNVNIKMYNISFVIPYLLRNKN